MLTNERLSSTGPAMGEIYYNKNLDWKLIQEKARMKMSSFEEEKKNT